MLVSGEEAIDAARRMARHGVDGTPAIDWPDLMAFKRTFTDPLPAKQAHRYAALGVDALHGVARFSGPDTLEVEGRTLRARHILLASGQHTVPPAIPAATQTMSAGCTNHVGQHTYRSLVA